MPPFQILFCGRCSGHRTRKPRARTRRHADEHWNAYTAGRQTLSNDDANEFVVSANRDGKTTKPWSATTIRRVASYLTGCCCADFGLPERGARSVRKILHSHIDSRTAAILAPGFTPGSPSPSHLGAKVNHRQMAKSTVPGSFPGLEAFPGLGTICRPLFREEDFDGRTVGW